MNEAARLIDASVRPVESIDEPSPPPSTTDFRDAVVAHALARSERPTAVPVAGVLLAPRWGGGGVMLT